MNDAELTYWLFRQLEEAGMGLLLPGQVLTYRSVSRFPWIDLIFDLDPATKCKITSANYQPLGEPPDFEPEDNHCYYFLTGLEEHQGICTTEIVSMFDLPGNTDPFDLIAGWIKLVIEEIRLHLEKQPYLDLQMKEQYPLRKNHFQM